MAENENGSDLSKLVSGIGLARDSATVIGLALALLAAGQPIPATVIGAGVIALAITKEVLKHRNANAAKDEE